MRIGLYFGTFNPIHVGHLIIANYMADMTELDKVWIMVTPQNPLKEKSSLLADYHRLALVRVAIEDNDNLDVSNIEFDLPKPSYTVNTLAHLSERHPEHEFALIMGEDNLRTLHRWKNHEYILEHHHIYVYPRVLTMQEEEEMLNLGHKPHSLPFLDRKNVHLCDAPVMKVSSSYIRKAISQGHDVQYLLTEPVYRYIDEMNFYKT